MAKLMQAFDSNQHDDMTSFEPVPADKYMVQITDSSLNDNKAKTGKYIKLEFTIIHGEYKGRKIWTNLNIVNKSAQAVEIAQKELATIIRATNGGQDKAIQDTQELHGIPFAVTVGIKPAKGDFGPQNTTKGYEPLKGGGPAKKPKTVKKTQPAEEPVIEGDDAGWDD